MKTQAIAQRKHKRSAAEQDAVVSKPVAQAFADQRTSAYTNTALQAKLQSSSQTLGMQALQTRMNSQAGDTGTAQRAGVEEDELLQGKFEPVQRVEEEELLQGKFETVQRAAEEEELQGKFETVQRAGIEEDELLQGKFEPVQRVEEEELLQGRFETAQRAGEEDEILQGKSEGGESAAAPKKNETGLPDQLKSGIESLSGMTMDDTRVHYNSAKPAELKAHAYAQGSDIHVAPGQERHLPHEAWHVIQQKQGRVKPTMQMKGNVNVNVNDDKGLETEADVMGAKALDQSSSSSSSRSTV